jgi:hypothetical protein
MIAASLAPLSAVEVTKPSAQRVAAEVGGVKADAGGCGLHD